MKRIFLTTFALVAGSIAGFVLAGDGLVPITYAGGLMAATVICVGGWLAHLLLTFSEDQALRFAWMATLLAVLVGVTSAVFTFDQQAHRRLEIAIGTDASDPALAAAWWQRRLDDPAAQGGALDSVRLRVKEGMVYGARESHPPGAIFRTTRRGVWVWLCWVGQVVILWAGAWLGCLAITVTGKKNSEERSSTSEQRPEQVGAASRGADVHLGARAAEAMMAGGHDLAQIGAEIHRNRLEQESAGDPSAFLLAALSTLYPEWVDAALKRGADPNAVDARGIPAIGLAARTGSIPMLESLLAHGADVTSVSSRGETALHMAAAEGQTEMLTRLLEAGCTLAEEDDGGRTPLWIACSKGHLKSAQSLHEHGARIEVHDRHGTFALHAACRNGHLAVVRWLLALGTAPDLATANDRPSIPLAIAIGFRHAGIVDALLNAGANPEGADGEAATPLMLAADSSSLAIVQRLLRGGAKKTTIRGGLTAFDYAEQVERPSADARHIMQLLR